MSVLVRSIASVVELPRRWKQAMAVTVDAGLCVLAVWAAYYLRLNVWVDLFAQWPAVLGALVIALPVFTFCGLYRAAFRYVGWAALTDIVQAVIIYGVIYAAVFTLQTVPGVPRTIGIIQPVLLLIALCGSRALVRYWLGGRYRQRLVGTKRGVLVYGAGSAGRQLAAAIGDSATLRVVGFIDDDRKLRGARVAGLPVWGPDRMTELAGDHEIAEVLLAIPSASRTRRNEILEAIRAAELAVRTLPGLMDIAHGKVTTSDLRLLEVDDLLGREAVRPVIDQADLSIRGKVVMVTGAGGSIGSELCRQIALLKPARLLLVDISEFALYTIHSELRWLDEAVEDGAELLLPLLGSVCDEIRMRRIFETWRPDVVFHAAAYKHVPLVEHNVVDGVRNNVVGTWTCARLARDHAVGRFVLVSTDKAVRPTNVMGASKRLAELVLQALADGPGATTFSMVRFGNVLGSSGSVVPLFRQQIAVGGPITVTHPDVIRYFMTIPEAAQLVLQANVMARGGEVFVLDMGEPVRIVDLATRMVELSGLKVRGEHAPEGDIEIVYTGLRPGEKLYEELLIGDDPAPTAHPRIMTANEQFLPADRLIPRLERLRIDLDDQQIDSVRAQLIALVDGFTAAPDNVDWIRQEERRQAAGATIRPAGRDDHTDHHATPLNA